MLKLPLQILKQEWDQHYRSPSQVNKKNTEKNGWK